MNTLEIKGQLYAHITIEGRDIPPDSGLYHEVTLIESIYHNLPSLQFSIRDTSRSTQQGLNIIDGTKVQVKISRRADDPVPYQEFSVFSTNLRGDGASAKLVVTCVLDVPKLSKVTTGSMKGSTSFVISKLAQDVGLIPDVITTSDSQVWLGHQMTLINWINTMVKASYRSDQAVMAIGITADKKLLYRDMVDQVLTYPVKTFSQDAKEGKIHIQEERSGSNSGVSNNLTNYGYEEYVRGGDGKIKTHNKVKAKVKENAVSINSDDKSKIDIRRAKHAPSDEGNTHPNYRKAIHQNTRLKALFSEKHYILTTEVSDVQLFDPVRIELIKSTADPSLTNRSGTYLVASKIRVIRGGTAYAEKFVLVRHQTKHEGPTNALNSLDDGASTLDASRSADLASQQKPFALPTPFSLSKMFELLNLFKSLNLNNLMSMFGLGYGQLGQVIGLLSSLIPPNLSGMSRLIGAGFPQFPQTLSPLQNSSLSNLLRGGSTLMPQYAQDLNLTMGQVNTILNMYNNLSNPSDQLLYALVRSPAHAWQPLVQVPSGQQQGLNQLRAISSNPYTSGQAQTLSNYLGSSPLMTSTQNLTSPQASKALSLLGSSNSFTHFKTQVGSNNLPLSDVQAGSMWTENQRISNQWLDDTQTTEYLEHVGSSPDQLKQLMFDASIPIANIDSVCELPTTVSNAKEYAYALKDTTLGAEFQVSPTYFHNCSEIYDIMKHKPLYEQEPT